MELIGLGIGMIVLFSLVLTFLGAILDFDTGDWVWVSAIVITVLIISVGLIEVYFKKHPVLSTKQKEAYLDQTKKKVKNNKAYLECYKSAMEKPKEVLLQRLPSLNTLKHSFFNCYYSEFYKTQEGLALLYTMAYFPSNDIKHPNNEDMIVGFNSMQEIDDKLLRTYPWLIKIFPDDVCSRGNDQEFVKKYK